VLFNIKQNKIRLMIIVISPAKHLNLKPQNKILNYTLPDFNDKASILMNELKKLNPKKIAELMKVNNSIADLNYQRFANWHLPFTSENAKQAVLTFNGEVYNGLKASTLNDSDISFAQDHLRILSGLYGILRPLDLIQPYRLEMSIKLATRGASNLYKFWGSKITDNLNKSLRPMKRPVLINLASAEYLKSVHLKRLIAPVISIEFWENKNEEYKVIVIYTKKARGMMSRFAIQNKITNPEELKAFDIDGYNFNAHYSTDWKWVFTRK
jgi:cytoplasmic iron level regulating protein YaaA (DUF328/UPF0246 family)